MKTTMIMLNAHHAKIQVMRELTAKITLTKIVIVTAEAEAEAEAARSVAATAVILSTPAAIAMMREVPI